MLTWSVAILVGTAIALLLYRGREPRRPLRVLPAAAMRALALALLLALLLDAPAGPRQAVPPLVALDVSASWLRGGDTARWREARERARRLAPDTLWLFGDSTRLGAPPIIPVDAASRVAPLAERALASGRPVRIITDGELDDPGSLGSLPSGSRVDVLPAPPRPDVAVVALGAPRAAVSGDTAEVIVTVRVGTTPVPRAALTIALSGRPLATVALTALLPGTERKQLFHVPLAGPEGPALLSASVAAATDVERRNDTLAVAVELVRAAGAVVASTSPDEDVRYLVPVLRGTVSLPTRAYFEVSPGNWRSDGALAGVTETEVRSALRDAPVAVLHGDTAAFGAPRALTHGALALLAPPPAGGGEWYVVAAPPSPVSPSLAGLPWDSLPPLELSPTAPRGDWDGLVASRVQTSERRPVVVGVERPRRLVVITASGFWRWQFRGGPGADAFTTLWGSIFDWLSTERADRRGAFPVDAVIRSGERIRWRRGAREDSIVVVVLRRRGARAGSRVPADSITLRFGAGGATAESDALPPGTYDVTVPAGTALLAVNESREWLPRAPTVRAGATGGRAVVGDQPRLRDRGWPFVLVLASLCTEWLIRRRFGWR